MMVALLNGPEVSVQKRTTFPLVPLVRALNAGRKDIGAMVFIFTVNSSVALIAKPILACPNGDSGSTTQMTNSRGSKRGRGSTRARGRKTMSKRGGKTKKNNFGAPDE